MATVEATMEAEDFHDVAGEDEGEAGDAEERPTRHNTT